MLTLLRAHGARHHVFSAVSAGSTDELREVLRRNTNALDRRSPTIRMTPLAWAVNNRHYDKIAVLLEYGANIEELNEDGRTVLAEAILEANAEAVTILRDAGATEPVRQNTNEVLQNHPGLTASVSRAVPMIPVTDIPGTLAWYTALGFTEIGRYWEHNELRWATMTFGNARVMLSSGREPQSHNPQLKLWFYTTRIDEVHKLVTARQLELAYEVLDKKRPHAELLRFVRDINNTEYGTREFAIRDPNGYTLYFIQVPSRTAT
ncbi:MAG: VOC family protein [Phycisphaerae bacterium]|nr:VOC family protein [Gemmatimonadaceae bacterium]